MALVVEFRTDRETFAASRALVGTEGLTIELERVIPTGESVVPYYWVWGNDLASYEDNLTSETGIECVDVIARTDDGTLYRTHGRNELSTTIRGLFDLDFTLLDGTCTNEGWEFEMRFPSSDAASTFQAYLNDHGVAHTLERVYQLTDPRGSVDSGLTTGQREALVVAYRSGYFEEPRATSLRELANRLDISPSSVAGRLRRGHAALIEEHIVGDAGERADRSARSPADGV